jgi:conflict system STAND superfamily ATPase/WD40 domain-containing protein
VYNELTGQQQELARRLFLRLVHVADDTADTRRRVITTDLLAEYSGTQVAEMRDVLDRFVAQRLITADTDTVEISHEALLTAWPQLRTWLDTDRDGQIIGRRLAEAAAHWRREHHDPAALYRGARLTAAQEWVETAGPRADVTALAQEFLNASRQREHEEHQVTRRRTRRLQQLVAVLAALFLVAGIAAVQAQNTATEQRNVALSQKVADEAIALRSANPALAAQLSLAAYRLAPTAGARGSVLSTFSIPYATQPTGHTGSVYAAVFSPDGRKLVTASFDHTARLWDVTDTHHPSALATIAGHAGAVVPVAFSPDGHTLATASGDRTARLWDITDPHRPGALSTLTGHTNAVRSVAFSPDGRTVGTASWDHTARLWNITNLYHPGELATLTGHASEVNSIAFNPDGQAITTASLDYTTRLWDTNIERVVARVCDIAYPVITRSEWNQYFAGLPYYPPCP